MKLSRLGLRNRLIVGISVVLAVSGVVLMAVMGTLASRAVATQANDAMQQIVGKTADELDLWIGSLERDAVNFADRRCLWMPAGENAGMRSGKVTRRAPNRAPPSANRSPHRPRRFKR